MTAAHRAPARARVRRATRRLRTVATAEHATRANHHPRLRPSATATEARQVVAHAPMTAAHRAPARARVRRATRRLRTVAVAERATRASRHPAARQVSPVGPSQPMCTANTVCSQTPR